MSDSDKYLALDGASRQDLLADWLSAVIKAWRWFSSHLSSSSEDVSTEANQHLLLGATTKQRLVKT
jgi:hypothetical protein